MKIQIFELQGCTKNNLPQVQKALASIIGWNIYQTVKGAFLLRIESDLADISLIQSTLKSLQVDMIQSLQLNPIVLKQ